MAATTVKKDAGGGWIEIVVGCNDADSSTVQQRTTICIVKLNRHAYDALGANGKAAIDGVDLATLIAAAFN